MKKLIEVYLLLIAILSGCLGKRADTIISKGKMVAEDQNLIKAIKTRDICGVIEALAKGADKEATDEFGITALMLASEQGLKKVVNMLIIVGANKEKKDKDGRTALMLASKEGYANIVKVLIRAGANKEATDKEGRTALMMAIERKNEERLWMLMKAKEANEIKDEDEVAALRLAIEYSRAKVIKLLYCGSSDINVRDRSGNTLIGLLYSSAVIDKSKKALFISIINYELKILRKLLQKRYDNLSIAVEAELKKIDKVSLRTIESLKALTMVMQCDSLIRYEIFKNVVEISPLNRYIMENPQLKIDERIFEIFLKYGKEKIEKITSEKIINLFIAEVSGYEEPTSAAWCIIS